MRRIVSMGVGARMWKEVWRRRSSTRGTERAGGGARPPTTTDVPASPVVLHGLVTPAAEPLFGRGVSPDFSPAATTSSSGCDPLRDRRSPAEPPARQGDEHEHG